MANNSNQDSKKKDNQELPAPELLRSQFDADSAKPQTTDLAKSKLNKLTHHGTYRPSHKATFIGIGVVVLILAINVAVISFVMKNQTTQDAGLQDSVTISPAVLDTLGVSRNTIGSSGTALTVNPDASFKGKVTVGGDVSIAGELKLNGPISATDSTFTKLVAGDVSVSQLNVNGDATMSSLSLRKDLAVAGSTQLQGAVTVGQLLTVNNSINVLGNLSIGGILSMGGFQTNILTVGGHIITAGSAPAISPGSYLGNNGTISISGNDISGTIAANIGTGGGDGILAYVSFVNKYSNTPHVMITTIGRGVGTVYVSRSATGFSIGVNGPLAPGGYAFDYIVMQ